MEYYVFVTRSCNLSCSYCKVPGLKYKEMSPGQNNLEITKLLKFIQSNKLDESNDFLVFYGGEPLLNQDFIKQILVNSNGTGIRYVLHTNGTLLDQIDPLILKKLNYLFVSIDGQKEIHDYYRGSGTYDLIIKNINAMKAKFEGKSLARMTYTPKTHLNSAVQTFLSSFDGVFWQIQNFL